MKYILRKIGKINASNFVKASHLAQKESETGFYGIEKEFAFTNGKDLSPCQRIGKHSSYHFVTTYGNLPSWLKKSITAEVFDYMIELNSDPCYSIIHSVRDAILGEIELWKAIDHLRNEFPNIDEIFLSQGTLFKPAQIEKQNIPEVWGEDKMAYLEAMIIRYGENLTPQGQHDNISIPEPLIAYQYHKVRNSKTTGSMAYVEFKNELYVWLAKQLRSFASLIIAIEANTPFDYTYENGKSITILTGYQTNRWLKLPQIESSNCPFMLKDYDHFQQISHKLTDEGVIIGANNYMPVRPKGERRLGEVPLSLERAAWFYDITIGKKEINSNPLLFNLKGKKHIPFLKRLKLTEKSGWLSQKGFTVRDIIETWQKDNVRRLLGVPLNRIEIRCCEAGGSMEIEIAKAAFINTLSFYIFSNPDFGAAFEYNEKDLNRVTQNELQAAKYGLNGTIIHPHTGKKINMRDFLKATMSEIEKFAKDIGTYDYLKPIYEYSKGQKNEAEKTIEMTMESLGKNYQKTRSGKIIVPEEIIRKKLEMRRYYVYELSRKLKTNNTSEIITKEYSVKNLNKDLSHSYKY